MYEDVKDAAEKKGLSINRLAILANIQPSDLYQVCNGKKPFFPAWRQRVAAALGVPEETLFNDHEN